MKVIFCKWTSICENGIDNALVNMGHDVVRITKRLEDVDYDKEYLQLVAATYKENSDAACVISVNFLPVVARVCNVLKLPYISWTVDCPSFQLYSKTIELPYNRIFLLDRMQYEKFAPKNPDCIFHMPLGCDIKMWDGVKLTSRDHKEYDCDISFIGSLYSEKCRYNKIKNLPDYIKGYVDGIIDAQLNIFGYNFIEDAISDELVMEFKKYADWIPLAEDYVEDIKAIVADTYIGYKCTEQDRIRTINEVSKQFNMDLYTLSDVSLLPDVNFRGGADSVNMMPQIIKCSKINLNMTNKPIKTGLPLRIFDIMGAGGFLISNYQAEIPEHFVDGEDLVLYESIPDLLDKIDYYLRHDDERIEIALNGYKKVKQFYSYEVRLKEIFKVAL